MANSTKKLDLEINMPVSLTLTEIAIMPANAYGPSVTIKGVQGDEAVWGYVKGKVWAVLKAFREAGVIPAQAYNEDPGEKTAVPIVKGRENVILELTKRAGDKYANVVVRCPDAVDNLGAKPVAVEEAETMAAIRDTKAEQRVVDVTSLCTVYTDVLLALAKVHANHPDAPPLTSDVAFKIAISGWKGVL